MLEKIENAFIEFGNAVLDKSPSILIGLLALVLFIIIGMLVRKIVKKNLKGRIEDVLLINFIGRMTFLLFLIIGTLIFLNQLGLGKAASGLMAGAGVSAIVIGFAFKDIGENFLAGFFLAFSRPFGIGDVIELEGIRGTAKALNFRSTHIRTFDGKDIFLPNAMLIKNPLINYTRDGLLRHDFAVGLDYGSSVIEAVKLMNTYLEKEKRIEHTSGLEPFVQLEEFGTSTLNIRVFYWINSYDFTGSVAKLKTEVMNNILLALSDHGFSMPADIVELKIYQEGQPIPLKMIS